MNEIKITLETLYDILRNEKKREDLQKLDDSFFVDIVAYLREKQSLIDSKKKGDDFFAVGERDKLEYELRSIKRIIKQLYELREKKIMDIAMNKSRTGSDIIDTSSMLRLEKQFYEQTLQTLDMYRRGVLHQLFKGELPDIVDLPAKPSGISSLSSSSSSSLSPPNSSSFSSTPSFPPARTSAPASTFSKPASDRKSTRLNSSHTSIS